MEQTIQAVRDFMAAHPTVMAADLKVFTGGADPGINRYGHCDGRFPHLFFAGLWREVQAGRYRLEGPNREDVFELAHRYTRDDDKLPFPPGSEVPQAYVIIHKGVGDPGGADVPVMGPERPEALRAEKRKDKYGVSIYFSSGDRIFLGRGGRGLVELTPDNIEQHTHLPPAFVTQIRERKVVAPVPKGFPPSDYVAEPGKESAAHADLLHLMGQEVKSTAQMLVQARKLYAKRPDLLQQVEADTREALSKCLADIVFDALAPAKA